MPIIYRTFEKPEKQARHDSAAIGFVAPSGLARPSTEEGGLPWIGCRTMRPERANRCHHAMPARAPILRCTATVLLIRRCAWHRRYFGRPKIIGVRWRWIWQKWGWTDGMCRSCASEFRARRGRTRAQAADP
jgi:hypothetical protein